MNALRCFLKKHGRPMLVGTLIGIGCAFGFASGALHSLSERLQDRLFVARTPDARIAIVAIDDASLASIGRWPWDRSVHAELIRALSKAGASVIAYDINFSEPQNGTQDADLAAAIQSSQRVILPSELSILRIDGHLMVNPKEIVAPLPIFESAAIRTGFSNTPPDEDGIVRFMPLRIISGGEHREIYPFSLEAAQALDASLSFARAPEDALGQIRIAFPGSPHTTYPTFSAKDILAGTVDQEALRGKLVFVGSTAADLHDEQLVQTSEGQLMPGVEIHAAFADTLLQQKWIRSIPLWQMTVLFIFFGLLIGWFASKVRAMWSITLTILFWFATLLGIIFLFEHGVMLNIFWTSSAILLIFIGVVIERRLASERDRKVIRKVFEHYVSPSIVDVIVRNPSKIRLGGERKNMTVLFSDIRVFTTLTESMDAGTLIRLLNIFLSHMTEEIFNYKGVLDKYMGDGIMAFWNAPFEQPDHPLLTVEAALAMQRSLADLNKAVTFGNPPWQMGIGINTGEMIVGNIGGENHADYTVIGDAVNLASRLEGLTRKYRVWIIVSESTAKELHDEMLLRRLDRVVVKGRFEAVTIYEVVCEGARATFEQKELVRLYEEMLNNYCHWQFEEAVAQCHQMLIKYPTDGPTLVIRDRARDFISEPPPKGWDGTWVFTEK
jgi:adenylate cyclase